MLRAAVAIVVTFCAGSQSSAEPPESPSRPAHYGAGVGGYSALTGPSDTGIALQAELYPGGGFGRLGGRFEVRGFDGLSSGYATAGVTFEAGAARPRLVMALHAELGVTFEEIRPVASGGVHTQLFIIGPLGIGLDSTVTLLYDGIETTLILGTAATLRLAI